MELIEELNALTSSELPDRTSSVHACRRFGCAARIVPLPVFNFVAPGLQIPLDLRPSDCLPLRDRLALHGYARE